MIGSERETEQQRVAMNARSEAGERLDKELTGTETLGFFSLAQDGSVKIPDLFRAWERLAPLWWQEATGTSRAAYWNSVRHFIVARYAKVTCAAGGLQVGAQVTTRLVTTAGTRVRGDGSLEAGAVDRFKVLRKADGALIGAVEQAWTWMDASGDKPVLANQPPPGLRCPQHALPPVEEMPPQAKLALVDQFTWSTRETDANRHISFLSYFERADNALAACGETYRLPYTWESWYRRECAAGEAMQTMAGTRGADGLQIVLLGESDKRRRVIMRHRNGAACEST
jgi:hypothetical protein